LRISIEVYATRVLRKQTKVAKRKKKNKLNYYDRRRKGAQYENIRVDYVYLILFEIRIATK
jgi:hypothetical protein